MFDDMHVDEGTMHAWIDGALSPAEAAKVEAHVASCNRCGALAADARGLVAASTRILSSLDDIPAGVIPDAKITSVASIVDRVNHARSVRRRAWLNGAGTLAAAVIVVVIGTRVMRAPTFSGSTAIRVSSRKVMKTVAVAEPDLANQPADVARQSTTRATAPITSAPAHTPVPVPHGVAASVADTRESRELAQASVPAGAGASNADVARANAYESAPGAASVSKQSAEAQQPPVHALHALSPDQTGVTAAAAPSRPFAAKTDSAAHSTVARNAMPSAGARVAHPVLLGLFVGTLPCSDCAGIRTELTLTQADTYTAEGTYVLKETEMGRGTSTVTRGEWTTLRGDAEDPDASVYQLDPDDPAKSREFVRVGNDEAIRMLGANGTEIGAQRSRFTLRRVRTAADTASKQ